MTVDEVIVAMNKALPVKVNSASHEWTDDGVYTVTQLNRSYSKWDKKNIYSATITKNRKHLYSFDIRNIEIADAYSAILEGFVEQLKKDKLKASIKELVEQGGNKTTITKLVKSIIDEIKK